MANADDGPDYNGVYVRPRGNQAMFLRMSGYRLKATGKVMGISPDRVGQILRRYQRDCKGEARQVNPRRYEVEGLLPHLESIKALYE